MKIKCRFYACTASALLTELPPQTVLFILCWAVRPDKPPPWSMRTYFFLQPKTPSPSFVLNFSIRYPAVAIFRWALCFPNLNPDLSALPVTCSHCPLPRFMPWSWPGQFPNSSWVRWGNQARVTGSDKKAERILKACSSWRHCSAPNTQRYSGFYLPGY